MNLLTNNLENRIFSITKSPIKTWDDYNNSHFSLKIEILMILIT